MTKRVAALLALVAFAVAWLIGVARGESPITRIENAALALAAAWVAGLAIGFALEKIVLHRLSDSWREKPGDGAGRDEAPTFEPAPAPARSAAAREADGVPAPVEAVR